MNLTLNDYIGIGFIVLFINDVIVYMSCYIFFLNNLDYYKKK